MGRQFSRALRAGTAGTTSASFGGLPRRSSGGPVSRHGLPAALPDGRQGPQCTVAPVRGLDRGARIERRVPARPGTARPAGRAVPRTAAGGAGGGVLAIYPFASAFAMAYTESLFLLAMVGAFLAAERGPSSHLWRALRPRLSVSLPGRRAPASVATDHASARRLAAEPLAAVAGPGPARGSGVPPVRRLAHWQPTAYLDAQQAWGREGVGGAESSETVAAMFSPYQGALLADPVLVDLHAGVGADRSNAN